MSELNINNLTLDDNTFEVLPDGDYHFTVESHELEYYSGNSDKIPPNTQQIVCHLEIPFEKDGEVRIAKVKNTLRVYKKALFAIRQFTDCIRLTPEKGRASLDIEKMDGRTGICSLTTAESASGNEYNRVQQFYAPSKAPVVTANDDAWKKKDSFMGVDDDLDIPFEV